jgi:hypothetical protein
MKNTYKIMKIISWIITALSTSIFLMAFFFPQTKHPSNGTTISISEYRIGALISYSVLPIILWVVTYHIRKNKIQSSEESLNEMPNKNESYLTRQNKTAVVGLISSLIAMFTGFGMFGYIGMTCGIVGLIQINKTKQKGKWNAITAIVIGTIYGIVMSLINQMERLG